MDVEDPLTRRRDANESPYHLGVGNRAPPQFIATATRTLSQQVRFWARPSLLKQPAAIAAVPLGIYLLLPSYRASRSLTRTNSIIQAAMLTAGFFAALGLVTIVLWKQGILHDAFYWTIADHDVPHVFWQKGIVAHIGVHSESVCLW